MDLIKDAPLVKVVMLKGADGAKSSLSELANDMTFLTREEITTLVNNIISSGSVGDIDTGFVTKIKELNKNKALTFWVGTQAEYNALATKTANTFYIITDDSYKEEIAQALEDINARIDSTLDYETEISDLQTRTGDLENSVNPLIYTPSDTRIHQAAFKGAGYIDLSSGRHNITFDFLLEKYLPDNCYIETYGDLLGLSMLVKQDTHDIVGSGSSEAKITTATIEQHGYFIRVILSGAFQNVTVDKICDVRAHMSFKVRER